MTQLPILTSLVFTPLAGAVVVAFVNGRAHITRWLGFLSSLLTLALAIWMFLRFSPGVAGMQMEERAPWIPPLGISYHLGVDGVSVLLVALTAVIFPLALLSSWESVTEKVREFTALMLLLETAILGTFLSLDLILFYVFWEGMLIPMYFLIGIWGGPRRSYAAIKFFLYTMAGSVLMLVAIVVLHLQGRSFLGIPTFDLLELQGIRLPPSTQMWLFAAFALAFAIKVPIWPLHTWLPDAHVEAPTAGSVILAALLLKVGAYGFLRFGLPLFPEASRSVADLFAILALIGIVYGGLVAWRQQDVKRLVAYSSVSHLGLVILGIFALNQQAIQGSLLQMVNHGISTGGLFLIVGILYDRVHTRMLHDFGGVARLMPTFAVVVLIVSLSSMALPGTNGFVGEFLILLGVFRSDWRYAAVAVLGVILSAVYLLWMIEQVMHGPVRARSPERLVDVKRRELLVFLPLLLLIFWIGIYPRPFLVRTEASVERLVTRVQERTFPTTVLRTHVSKFADYAVKDSNLPTYPRATLQPEEMRGEGR